MKMKKILALLLALVMCVGLLAACNSDDKETEVPTEDQASGTGQNDTRPASESDVSGGDSAAVRPASDTDIDDSDYLYITGNGKMVIGVTPYEPMNYLDDNGEWTGFDTEFAIAVCEKLGVEPEFIEISWETKEIELNSKTIDCIWNGMTITADRAENMSISLPYVKNAQVIVVKADSGYTTTSDLIGKTVVAEVGSAGEAQVSGDDAEANLAQSVYIGVAKQIDCLMEVKSGTADAAVLDWTLAMSMVGEDTDYSDLQMIPALELGTEEYGIAFRKGSAVTEYVNAAILELVEDGTLSALAEKYGLSLSPEITG